MRVLPELRIQRDVLCCILDGMDKSKFMLPRWKWFRPFATQVFDAQRLHAKECLARSRASELSDGIELKLRPKDADHLKRPHVNLTGMIVHGLGTYVFLTDECQSGGSNWHIECLMRGLDMVWKHRQRGGQPHIERRDRSGEERSC
jgi:hypothetical protein